MKNYRKKLLFLTLFYSSLVLFSQHELKENYTILEYNNSSIVDEYLSITFLKDFFPQSIEKVNDVLVTGIIEIDELFSKYEVIGILKTSNNPNLGTTRLIECKKCDVVSLQKDLLKLPYFQYVDLYSLGILSSCYFPQNVNEHSSTNNYNQLDLIRAREAWNITKGNVNTRIAVIDHTSTINHPDLNNKISIARDLTSIVGESNDRHGYQVAGLAGASTNNSYGIASTGYNTGLMTYNIATGPGGAFVSGVAGRDAIYDAVADGAAVINMSFEYPNSGSFLAAVQHAETNGVTVVSTAGNVRYNDACDIVTLCVTSVDLNDEHGPTGNEHGTEVDIVAPDRGFWSPIPGPSHGEIFSGTSYAAPQVSAAAALMLRLDPSLTPAEVRQIIRCSADDIYGVGNNSNFTGELGGGRLNVLDALLEVEFQSYSPQISGQTYVGAFQNTAYEVSVPVGDPDCYSYDWFFPSGWSINSPSNKHLVYVTTSSNGGQISVRINSKCSSKWAYLYVYNSGFFSMTLAPNPTSDYFDAEITSEDASKLAEIEDGEYIQYEIFDNMGNPISSKGRSSKELKQRFFVSDLSPGIYHVRATHPKLTIGGKIEVTK